MDLSPYAFYIETLVAYFVIYNILTWGLNIQFGYAGIPNFTYITFMAAGAYFTAVFSVKPATSFVDVHYILGLSLPFPLSLLGGAVVAAILAFGLGVITLRRLRSDYLAIVTFSLGFVAYDIVNTYQPLFNGFEGMFGVQPPLADVLHLDLNQYPLFFILLSGVIMAVLWVAANRIYNSALGRTMRAIREDLDVAEALGKDTFRFRMIAMVIGCFYAGIGGGLLIEFIGAINPSGWAAPETFILFAALLVGGRANNLGTFLGCLIVPVILLEGSRFIPVLSTNPSLDSNVRFAIVGALLMLVIWFRPAGILPERKRFYEIPLSRANPEVNALVSR